MIDIEKAKVAFREYVKNYDINNKKINLKIAHIERTSSISRKIAEKLNLNEEEVKLAELIGLLHDVGRFEQVKRYNTFVDKISINHAKLGAEILFEENKIRDFIEDNKYDEIIKIAILNHNKSPKDLNYLNEKEELYSKIIRDADKIDIMYILTFEEKQVAWEKADVENDKITDEIYREFFEDNCINYKNIKTSADILVANFAYIFDFNYNFSLGIIKNENYLTRIYNRFNFKDNETNERIKKIYEYAIEYMNNNK